MEMDPPASKPRDESEGPLGSLVTLLPPLEAAANLKQRADLLSLKGRLAALLPPEDGLTYWSALVDFVSGKISRQELGVVMRRVLGVKGKAVQLHNALLLSILYNTTRTSVPPSAIRHSGWHKRPRDKDGLSLEDRDPKRRRLKSTVMAIGKRERAALKTLGLGKKDVETSPFAAETGGDPRSLRASLDSRGGPVPTESSPALQEEYLRCLQTPLCCESRLLPDVSTLQDRMNAVAYESGLTGGADARVAALGVQAIEGHLRSMIASVVSLVRTDRANGVQTSLAAQKRHLSRALDLQPPELEESADTAVSNEGGVQQNGDVTLARQNGSDDPAPPPLGIADVASLFEISPHLLVQPHVGVVERMYAIPPLSDSSEDDDDGSDDDHDAPPGNNESAAAAPEVLTPRASGKTSLLRTVSRSGSRSGKSSTLRKNSLSVNANGGPAAATAGGRDQYLIDPSAIVIPMGHPDVAHPRLSSTTHSGTTNASRSAPRGGGGGVGGDQPEEVSANTGLPRSNTITNSSNTNHNPDAPHAGLVSPKSLSLRNQLFPELEGDGGVVESPAAMSGSPSMDTTTDAASDTDEGAKGKGKLVGALRKPGRKLWEVVDSVRLLDGVLN